MKNLNYTFLLLLLLFGCKIKETFLKICFINSEFEIAFFISEDQKIYQIGLVISSLLFFFNLKLNL
jgi:hypothetical protein